LLDVGVASGDEEAGQPYVEAAFPVAAMPLVRRQAEARMTVDAGANASFLAAEPRRPASIPVQIASKYGWSAVPVAAGAAASGAPAATMSIAGAPAEWTSSSFEEAPFGLAVEPDAAGPGGLASWWASEPVQRTFARGLQPVVATPPTFEPAVSSRFSTAVGAEAALASGASEPLLAAHPRGSWFGSGPVARLLALPALSVTAVRRSEARNAPLAAASAAVPGVVPPIPTPLRRATTPMRSHTWGDLTRWVAPAEGSSRDALFAPVPEPSLLPTLRWSAGTEPSSPWATRRPSTLQAPAAPAEAHAFLPIFRSAIVDRPEPAPEHREEAAALLATSSGAPLTPPMQRSMEQRFGFSLGAVRLHTGPAIRRAADLLSARAMTRGADVYMPSAPSEAGDVDGAALLAHELSHAATHLGARPQPAVQRTPLVLAPRNAPGEAIAEQVERRVAEEIRERPQAAPAPQVAMPLARTAAAPAIVQPATLVTSQTAVQRAPTPDIPAPADAGAIAGAGAEPVDAAKLADKVYAMIERRLLVERERGAFRR
jgi:hypothetical protein